MKRGREDAVGLATTHAVQSETFWPYPLLLPELKHYLRAVLDDHHDRLHLAKTCHEEYAAWPYRLPAEWHTIIQREWAHRTHMEESGREIGLSGRACLLTPDEVREQAYIACVALIIKADAPRKWPRFLDNCTMSCGRISYERAFWTWIDRDREREICYTLFYTYRNKWEVRIARRDGRNATPVRALDTRVDLPDTRPRALFCLAKFLGDTRYSL
jgi:hypothetical protein